MKRQVLLEKVKAILEESLPHYFTVEQKTKRNCALNVYAGTIFVASIDLVFRVWTFKIPDFNRDDNLFFEGRGWYRHLVSHFLKNLEKKVESGETYLEIISRLYKVCEQLEFKVGREQYSIIKYSAISGTYHFQKVSLRNNSFCDFYLSVARMQKTEPSKLFEFLDKFKEDDFITNVIRQLLVFNLDIAGYFSITFYSSNDVKI
jgi:hypothetical protein